jgi:hypothetical protein
MRPLKMNVLENTNSIAPYPKGRARSRRSSGKPAPRFDPVPFFRMLCGSNSKQTGEKRT